MNGIKTGLLVIALHLLAAGAGAQEQMKFLSYNVLHGFSYDTAVRNTFIDWVRKIDPDVVAYQELNEYKQPMLEELGKRIGHPYAVISKESGHPVGITSRYPITNVQKVADSMWHGYLYAQIRGIHVFVTHLAPFTLADRRKDLRTITGHINKLPSGAPVIVAGDFNSLSAVDSALYGTALRDDMRKSEGRLEPKSGTAIVNYKIIYRNNLDNGNIDYTVMSMMRDAGLVDAFYVLNKKFKHSAPTKGHQTKKSHLRRIDYIWVDAQLAKKLTSADIIHDETTHKLSDHYPVMIRFDF